MKLTNETNLPAPLYAAALAAPYSRGESDISATALIQPPRKVALEERHAALLAMDVSRMGAMIGGNAFHAYVQGDGEWDDAARLSIRVNGWIVSGQTDHVDGTKIVDYKTCRASKVAGNLIDEWEKQLNIYAELRRAHGYVVESLEVCAWLKDWSVEVAERSSGDYPQADLVVVPIPLWDSARAQAYILERVLLHQEARISLPECPEDELWRDKEWAVVKSGAAKAYRTYATEAEANEALGRMGDGYYVRFTKQEPRRCRFYCDVGRHGLCAQWNADRERMNG